MQSLISSVLLITRKHLKLADLNTSESLLISIGEEGAWALPGAVTFDLKGRERRRERFDLLFYWGGRFWGMRLT